MAQAQRTQRDLSARRIVGFACNQAFIFLLFYAEPNRAVSIGDFAVSRFDLLATLLFMAVGFAVVRALGRAGVERAFSRPLLYVYAVVAAAGSLLPLAVPDGGAFWLAAQGALVGVPLAYLLTAWGRAFGREPMASSVPEVFLGCLAAALVFLLFTLVPESGIAMLAARLLPLAGVVNVEVPEVGDALLPTGVDSARGQSRLLSAKILAGTLLFGLAGGVAEGYCATASYGWGLPDAAVPFCQVGIVLFGAFLVGSLSILLADGPGRGDALNKSYRLAVFVMVLGAVLVPWPLLAASAMPGEAVVLAGYLGLEAVFVALFIVMAKVTGIDCAFSFSAGFTSLFAGEFVGVVAGSVLAALCPADAPYAAAVLAGGAVLAGYLFLFTERDFAQLSQIATASDAFEDTCAEMTARFGLSKRESEILAFALRGRTSERIAQELVIAKSTVDTHLRRIYAKCEVHSRQELLDLAEGMH